MARSGSSQSLACAHARPTCPTNRQTDYCLSHLHSRRALPRPACRRSNTTALLLLALWVLHYGHRTFVYPLQVSSRSVAFAIWALGAFYNVINGFMNAYAVAHQPAAAADRHTQPSFLLGAALFVCGKAINMWADARLTALRPAAERARGEHRYVLPRGGLFELVSCPHYFGELVMWGGWALAAASLPALAFFVFCVCNIGARALSHHEWYRLRFKETMPPARKALVPYLL